MNYDSNINSLQEVLRSFEGILEVLYSEQNESANQYADWKNDEAEKKGDEPDIINHNDEIDRIEKAKTFIEKAIGELE